AALYRDEVVPGARSAYDATARGFEFGKFAFLDVLDAQRTLLGARERQLRAQGDARRALADIERLLGVPASTLTEVPQ
ncbi:MAG TPA: TolC family protein, partial [Telluria sp.]